MTTYLNLTEWFAIALAAVFVAMLLYNLIPRLYNSLTPGTRVLALKHFIYPVLIPRRYYGSMTRLQGLLVSSYVLTNGFCMGIGIKTRADLLARSGMMASIQMIPLFLGGRTSVLASWAGLSLHTYYIAHHWIGRVVIILSLLHVGLAFASGTPWTFDSSQLSGLTATSALGLILLLSVFFIRKIAFEFFLKVHFILAFVAILALLIHLIPLGLLRWIFPAIALFLWTANACIRFGRMAYRNFGGINGRSSRASIRHFTDGPVENGVSAMRLTIQLRRPMEICPGQYLYLFMSDMGMRRRLQAHPYVIAWWDDSLKAKTLSFLIEPQDGLSADLLARNSMRTVTVDGPYGKDLKLEASETVILVAYGIGIAGILPHLRHMTYRRVTKDEKHESYRRGLLTRKIDVFWVLEDNGQAEWIADWISELQVKDSEKMILTFTCFLPQKQSKPTPIPEDSHWRFKYQLDALPLIQSRMLKQVKRSPGKTTVAVCGVPRFSSDIRRSVINMLDKSHDISYVEVEFRPQPIYPEYSALHREDAEIADKESTQNSTIEDINLELGEKSLAKINRRRTQILRSVEGSQVGSARTRMPSRTIREQVDGKRVNRKSGLSSQMKTVSEEPLTTDVEMQVIGRKGTEIREFV